MGNAYILGASIFFLLFIAYFTTQFDRDFCPDKAEWLNETTSETGQKQSWTDYIWASKCSNMPSWYKLLIYTPFIAMGVRSVLP